MGFAAVDDGERPADELQGGGRTAAGGDRPVERLPAAQRVEQPGDRAGVGAGPGHGGQVQLEVAGVAAVGKLVRLFVEHDLVDEPAGLRIRAGHPGHARAGEPLLQGLEQALEVPDRENVVLHEPPQPLGTIDEAVDRVADEPLAAVAEGDGGTGQG